MLALARREATQEARIIEDPDFSTRYAYLFHPIHGQRQCQLRENIRVHGGSSGQGDPHCGRVSGPFALNLCLANFHSEVEDQRQKDYSSLYLTDEVTIFHPLALLHGCLRRLVRKVCPFAGIVRSVM